VVVHDEVDVCRERLEQAGPEESAPSVSATPIHPP
jgi:hypothetical protein